jgi:hypothetical protein
MSKNAKPAARINVHPVSAAIWRNENAKGVFYSATFERSYRNEEGTWQASSSFGVGDLLVLAKVADLAHSKIIELRAGERHSEQTWDETI